MMLVSMMQVKVFLQHRFIGEHYCVLSLWSCTRCTVCSECRKNSSQKIFCFNSCFYIIILQKSDYTSQLNPTNGTSSLRDPSDKDVPKPGPSAGTSSVPPVPQDFSSSVPYPGHHPSHTSVPPLVPPSSATSSPTVPTQAQARSPPDQPKPAEDRLDDTPKVTCHHCSKQFNTKPLLLSRQVKKKKSSRH